MDLYLFSLVNTIPLVYSHMWSMIEDLETQLLTWPAEGMGSAEI